MSIDFSLYSDLTLNLYTLFNELSEPELSPVDKKRFRNKVNFAEAIKEYFTYKKELYEYEAGYLSLDDGKVSSLKDKVMNFETDEKYSIVVDYVNVFGFDKDIRELSYGTLSAKSLQDKITKYYELKVIKNLLQSKYSVGDVIPSTKLKEDLKSIKERYKLTSNFKLVDLGSAFIYRATNRIIDKKKQNVFLLERKAV